MESATQAQQAVLGQYDAQNVEAIVRRQGGSERLEVVLVNPGGREATNRQRARTVGAMARQAYDGALDTVRVGFEYSSRSGPAQVGFHRRYDFSAGQLEGAADSARTARDTASTADTSAARRQR